MMEYLGICMVIVVSMVTGLLVAKALIDLMFHNKERMIEKKCELELKTLKGVYDALIPTWEKMLKLIKETFEDIG